MQMTLDICFGSLSKSIWAVVDTWVPGGSNIYFIDASMCLCVWLIYILFNGTSS